MWLGLHTASNWHLALFFTGVEVIYSLYLVKIFRKFSREYVNSIKVDFSPFRMVKN